MDFFFITYLGIWLSDEPEAEEEAEEEELLLGPLSATRGQQDDPKYILIRPYTDHVSKMNPKCFIRLK